MTSARNNFVGRWLAAAWLACCLPVLASIPAVRPPDCELRTPANSAVCGRTTLETDADGTQHRYVRDAAGNPVYEVRRDGTVIGREFDTLNRLTSVWTLPAGTATTTAVHPSTLANAVLRQSFEYDAMSRLVRAVDHNDPTTTKDDRETRYAYDSLGHIVSETEDDKAVLSYWDARSNRSALTYPGGRTVTIERDAATRPITVTDDGSAEAFALEYDAASRLTCVRSPGLQQRFSYYDNGSEWQRHFDLKTGASYTNFAWLDVTGYDFRNLANADRRILPNLQSTSTYGYDNRGRHDRRRRRHPLLDPRQNRQLADPARSPAFRRSGYDHDLHPERRQRVHRHRRHHTHLRCQRQPHRRYLPSPPGRGPG